MKATIEIEFLQQGAPEYDTIGPYPVAYEGECESVDYGLFSVEVTDDELNVSALIKADQHLEEEVWFAVHDLIDTPELAVMFETKKLEIIREYAD